MDEEAGILRAIVENPDDVTHRLVYADWLEEHGRQRLGQFIRAHCTLHGFLVDPVDDAALPSAVEIMRIQPELRPTLLAAFYRVYEDLNGKGETPEAVLTRHFGFWVHRGLIEYVRVYGGDAFSAFLRHAQQILAEIPLLHLGICAASEREGWTLYTPFTVHATPAAQIGMRATRTLLKQPGIVHLRSLDLSNLRLGNALGTSLLKLPSGFRPGRLLLDGNRIEEAMTERLRRRFGRALVLTPFSPEDEVPF
jgi:uncharacterized protein (TIGR02996 family)